MDRGSVRGDEPFLEREIFAQTLLSHFLSGADVTLCGKIPETVVDKGGLFFDAEGRLTGTKEWVRHDGNRTAGDVGTVCTAARHIRTQVSHSFGKACC